MAIIDLPFGLSTYGGLVSAPPSVSSTFLALDFSRVFEATFLIVVFTMLFVDLVDTAGTLIGTARSGRQAAA